MSSLPTIDILSLFPDTLRAVLDSSILRRAQVKGLLQLETTDLRSFSDNNYKSIDDTPFGGSQGMLFTAPVLDAAMNAEVAQAGGARDQVKIAYMSPRGLSIGQNVVSELSNWLGSGRRLVIVCGRYEGVDERFVEKWVDLELSVGDFITTGGELPALLLTDAIVRLYPGVLGRESSHRDESFSDGLLEYPQYTKPREFGGQGVPEVLLSGHHVKIAEWKLRESLLLSFAFRPDLIRAHTGRGLPEWAVELLSILKKRLDQRL